MVKNQFDDFDEFILWLKDDGLKPKTSERLWKKKIFSNLLNNHKNTIANYNDFLVSKKLKSVIGCKVIYQNINKVVFETTSNNQYHIFIMDDNSIIKIKNDLLDVFITNYVQEL